MTPQEFSDRIAGLIAEACARESWTLKELCEVLGIDESVITKKRKTRELWRLTGGLILRISKIAGYEGLEARRQL